MPVNSTHPDYEKSLPKWTLVRHIVDNNAKAWIRNVDPNDPIRSEQYKSDAILTNFTRLTKIGLVGLVFRQDAEFTLPNELAYIEDDATGYGFGLEQLAQQIAGEVLITGRYGLAIDYPSDANGVARFRPYTAENVINWKYREVGSEYKLALVVLKECIDADDLDGFEWHQQEQYRVLFLNKENQYEQMVFNHEYELKSQVMPLDYNEKPFNEIPFVFVGSENNDNTMDTIPLYDMAIVNLGHYRNSADLEESIFINGQPYPIINVGDGVSAEEFKQVNPDGVKFGSRKGLILGGGGSASLLQANANQMVSVEMKRKEEQAASIGARLIAPAGGRETAEAAGIRWGSQNSALNVIVSNIDAALEKGLYWVAQYMMSVPSSSEVNLNKEFYEKAADPNMVASLLMGFDRGLLKDTEIRQNYRDMGLELDGDDDITPVDPLMGTDNVTE